jgi:LEA14-like dessication related protein
MLRRQAIALTWLSLALTLSGCSTLGLTPDALKVTVSNIAVIEATLLEQLYRVTLRIQNRSDRPVSLSGGSFDLDLNGREFGSGVTDEAVTIEPFSDTQVDVRMVSTVFGIVRLVQGLQGSQGEPLSYEISGRFSTGGLVPLSFRESGEIALPRQPAERPLN